MSGIYVHIPFCKSKCTYCDFASYPREIEKAELYFACLYKEIKGRAEALKDRIFNTVYFGGGTPTLLSSLVLADVLNTVKSSFKVTADAEITAECNPATADLEYFKIMRKAGFNRLSLGVQSMVNGELKALGRLHSSSDVKSAVAL